MKKLLNSQKFFLNLFFLIVIFVFASTTYFSYQQKSHISTLNKWVSHTHETINALHSVLLDVFQVESLIRGYIITNSNEYLITVDKKIEKIFADFDRVKRLTSDNPRQQELINNLKPLLLERLETLKKTIEYNKSTNKVQTTLVVLVQKGQNLTSQITEEIEDLYNNELYLLNQREENFLTEFNNNNIIMNIINIMNLLILLMLIIFLNYLLAHLWKSREDAKKIANILNGIIGGSKEFIAALDLNFNFLAFNQAFEREFRNIFGKHVAIGMNFKEALAHLPEEQKRAVAIWARALKGEEFTVIEAFGSEDLARNQYEITYNGIYDEQNKLIGASVIARDIGKRLEAERKLKKFNQKLEVSLHEVEDQAKEMTIINDLNNKLRSSFTLDESLATISLYLKKLLPFSAGIIYLMNHDKSYLEAMSEWNNPIIDEGIFSPEQCLALRQGNLYFFVNESESIPCVHLMSENNLCSYFCVPLQALNEMIGLLYIEIIDSQKMTFDEIMKIFDHYNRIIQGVAAQISLSISNIKLHEVLKTRSTRDVLTNLFNRSYLEETFDRDIRRAKRKNSTIVVVMMDLDFFKSINDTFGHEAGDLALKMISNLLGKFLRKSDIACRYGGEEILILMYDTTMEDALEKIELLKKEIANLHFPFSSDAKMTASFGMAMFPEAGDTAEELIQAADKALYESKNEGRNKITIYKP